MTGHHRGNGVQVGPGRPENLNVTWPATESRLPQAFKFPTRRRGAAWRGATTESEEPPPGSCPAASRLARHLPRASRSTAAALRPAPTYYEAQSPPIMSPTLGPTSAPANSWRWPPGPPAARPGPVRVPSRSLLSWRLQSRNRTVRRLGR